MLNRKIDKQLADFFSHTKQALLLTGARQVGKTHSIRTLGRRFKRFIEINFIEQPQAVKLFANAHGAQDILLRIATLTNVPMEKGKTLIFFDEVQQCPEIATAIKFLVQEGSYQYVLSGSLLGVALNDLRSQPVGYMHVMEMFPLDFEEFTQALGLSDRVLDAVRNAWENKQPLDDMVHGKMMELFRLYLIIGGMPAVVDEYTRTYNLQAAMTLQKSIIQLYKRDIAQYDPQNKLYIQDIFDLIPPELNAKNKRFVLKRLNEHAKFDRLENSFIWLTKAGVALPVFNVEEPKPPLLLARSRNLLKLFQNDIGLLACQYADGIQMRIISADKDINCGAVFENAVAQELTAHGLTPYYYNSKRRGEVDFLIEMGGKVMPIEVKSGKDYASHRALSNLLACKEYDLQSPLVLTTDNLRTQGSLTYAPVYMAMFLQRNSNAPTHYKVDLTTLGL